MEDIDAPQSPRRPGRPPNASRQAPAREAARETPRPRAGKIRVMTAENRYEFDKSRTPPGMTVEWRVQTVMGAPHTEAIIADEMNGWVPVPASRHPELAGRTPPDPNAPIIRAGLMLMERPEELTEESRMMDSVAAHEQKATQFKRLRLDYRGPAGERQAKIHRQFAEIPDDE